MNCNELTSNILFLFTSLHHQDMGTKENVIGFKNGITTSLTTKRCHLKHKHQNTMEI